jgi:transcription initiation factor TFIIIB Brf1 subunit/transcription initiation factor TFIIB
MLEQEKKWRYIMKKCPNCNSTKLVMNNSGLICKNCGYVNIKRMDFKNKQENKRN